MTDPYFYLKVVFILNAISTPLYLIFTSDTIVGKLVRLVLSAAFMVWQAYILLNQPQA